MEPKYEETTVKMEIKEKGSKLLIFIYPSKTNFGVLDYAICDLRTISM